jgi:hypothetical protein
MTDEKNAAPISAKDFVSAYVETHKTGGTIADLASRLERSVDQVRAKKNSLSAQMRERGVKLPSLKRVKRDGSSYDEAAELLRMYTAPPVENSEV